jgi:pimeloyl-ACP methyl ester carboxylesterase
MDVKELSKRFTAPALLVSSFLFLACGGCASPHAIAKQVLEAPNRRIIVPRFFQQLGAVLDTNFPAEQVAVGPPPATLDLTMMEPGDYHVKLNSTFTEVPPTSPRVRPRYDFHFNFDLSRFSPKPKSPDVRGTIFLLHGYGLDKEAMMPWGLVLAKAGYRVVLVDLRGNGHSTGDRIYFGDIERTDMVQCLDALMQQHVCQEPVGVLGISYGAVLALQWAAIDSRVQSVAAISPYPDVETAVDRYLKTFAPNLTWRTDRESAAWAASQLAGFPDLDTAIAIRRIKQPILFVRGEHDEVCLREDLTHFQAAAPQESETKEVPLANHLAVGMCISQLSDPVTEWFHNQLTGE